MAKREEGSATIKAAELRGHQVSPAVKADTEAKLREFDKIINQLETGLAAEYERFQAERKKEAEITKMIDKAMVTSQHLYLIIKHEKPHLLESFSEACLGPLLPEEREEFLDQVAILEATKLDAILKGED